MCDLVVFTTLSETLFVLGKIERDMVKNIYWPSRKVPPFLCDFDEKRFSRQFRKILKYQILSKSAQSEPNYSMRTDG